MLWRNSRGRPLNGPAAFIHVLPGGSPRDQADLFDEQGGTYRVEPVITRFRLRTCCVRMLGPAKHELWHYHQRRDEQDRNDKRSWHGDPFDRRVPTNFMVINKGFLGDSVRVPSITRVTPPFKPTHAAPTR